jgi:hypothetical protein
MAGDHTKLSAITPLEGVIGALFEKVQRTASGTEIKKLPEVYRDYLQRREDLYGFFRELENNPLGFSTEEIEELEQRAAGLDQQLDMIGLYLDIIPHSPDIAAESINIYLKKYDQALDKVEHLLSQIAHAGLREALVKHSRQKAGEILQIYSLEKIQKTVALLNQYFLETSEDRQNYNHLLGFLEKKGADWIPVGREIYQTVLSEQEAPLITADNDVRLKQIERKLDAFELEIVADEKKPARLREIQALKNELNRMPCNEKIILLQAKLDGLAKRILPKVKGLGFFGGLKPANLMTTA